jgi:hypothetical protein
VLKITTAVPTFEAILSGERKPAFAGYGSYVNENVIERRKMKSHLNNSE